MPVYYFVDAELQGEFFWVHIFKVVLELGMEIERL